MSAAESGSEAHVREHDDAFLRRALDPARSVVVDACAGSGKTWLLVSRIVRLLLAGAAPGEILAITYTRKGAQEVRARLADSLRVLATAPDHEVLQFLRLRMVPENVLPQALQRSRRLFETCLNAQPGVNIDTFHGWFLQLLERAPLNARESALPADFTLDERISFLVDEAWDLFGGLLQQPESAGLAAAFHELAAELGYVAVRTLLSRFLQKRAEWWAYTRDAPDAVAFALERLRSLLGVDPDRDPLAGVMNDPWIAGVMDQLSAVDPGTSKTQEKFLRELAAARSQADPRLRFEALYASCHTQAGTPSQLLAKFFAKCDPALGVRFGEFCSRLSEARDARIEFEVYRLHQRALPCAVRLLDLLQQIKRGRQIIDFTDIEWYAYRLLADSDDAAFMHAKLDARYRHILLDEFQDTNPLQWQALRAWLDAYGADSGRPTVFLVGDPKQSIYRFRRAEPRLFGVAADALERDYGAVRLTTVRTRRCAGAIVDVVNAMFSDSTDYPDFHPHTSLAQDAPGYVEVIPLARNEPRPEVEAAASAPAWRDPLREALPEEQDDRRLQEATAVAAAIRGIVGRWQIAGSAGQGHGIAHARPARYSDIMILKRSRAHLADYEHALRLQGIPFLTSRHGGLLNTLEATDLNALIEVLIAPFDDLKLAHALRSPVFACADGDLVSLAQCNTPNEDGSRRSWWRRLEHLAQSEPPASPALLRAQRLLASWRAAADTEPVHDLLDRIYHEGDVIARYRTASPSATAGQVTANLERFLELALELDSGRYPSLPRFVAELGRMRLAPDQEAPDEGTETGAGDAPGAEAHDAVRIYTVHGAKGLEAPVVFLIDANRRDKTEANDVLVDWPPQSPAPAHFSLYTSAAARGARRAALFSAQEELAARERLNLLYVSATRARSYLLLSGVEDAHGKSPAGSAYERVASAVGRLAIAACGLPAHTHGKIETAGAAVSPVVISAARAPRPAVLKGFGSRREETPESRMGTQFHRIMDHLQELAPGVDPAAAARMRRRLGLTEAEFSPLWAKAVAVARAPALQRFFDPAAYLRAENEIEVIADGELRRIDRLVEFESEVWILDYKSGEHADRDAWRAQLALYRSLLRPLFAGKNLHSAVILADAGIEEFDDPGLAGAITAPS